MSPLGVPKNALQDNQLNTAINLAAETIVANLNGVDTTQEGDVVILEGYLQILTGASTTAVQLRIRRGGLAGVQVGATAQQAIGAGVQGQLSIQTQDVPGEQAGGTYTLTAQQVGGTVNGTAVEASLQATY